MPDDTKPEFWGQTEESDHGRLIETTVTSKDKGTDSFDFIEEIIITKVK